jgi:hypothetical protein
MRLPGPTVGKARIQPIEDLFYPPSDQPATEADRGRQFTHRVQTADVPDGTRQQPGQRLGADQDHLGKISRDEGVSAGARLAR